MNESHPSASENVADQNVERLIREGYRPEALDAGFVSRVQEQMLAAADEQRQSRAQYSSDPSPLADAPSLSLMSAGWGVAILLLIGIIAWTNFDRPPAPTTMQRQGDVVWIDGKPYVAESASQDPLPGDDLRPLDEMLVGFHPAGRKYDVSPGLVARERPPQAKPQTAKIGDEIQTAANEQRRLTLPDGSVLFVDKNSRAVLVAEREVEVSQGEVFVEVAPKVLPDETRGTFVVKTNERTVTALGTKFGVRTGESPRVLVTQGKVEISGVEYPLSTGQQCVWTGGTTVVEAAPRADVALDWMRDLVVAAEGALIPANEKAGGDLIAVDPDGQDVKLSLRKYHIDVHIEDGFARTTIDQTYFNHMWSRLEGTFYFPLPPDASLSRLAMYVGPKLMEGGMAERDYARQVFETIKTKQLDPALLEWVDGSTFKMRVFPLEPRQEKRIIMSYTQKLDISYGRTRYRFPAGHNMKIVDDWSVKLRVKEGRGLLWDSPSHTLATKHDGRDLILTAEEKLSRLDKDVVLFLNDDSVARADADRKSALLSTTKHDDAHYLMLRWQPELPTEKTRQRRDWVFLFESSADRDPLLARTQVEIIRTILNHAEHDDTFAIVSAGAYTNALSNRPLAVSPKNIAEAIKYLEQTHLVGGLDVEQAFRSLATFTKDAENPVIVHVGSGTPILGEREVEPLVQALPRNAQYVGVGVGKRYNRSLMKQAAARSGGYFTQINPDESISWRGFELISALNTPRLLDIRIETDSGACQMLSFQDSLAHGEQLTAIGRYEAVGEAPSELTITGQLDGQPFKQTVPVREVEKSTGPLPRMWAKQQIELLTSLGAQQHKDQIIKLSKAMYVMSPFTSLLVLENEEMYEQYKIDRGRKDHWALYPAPETVEVVEERGEGRGARGEGKDEGRRTKDGEEDEEQSEESEEEDDVASSKPSVEEVLGTILVRRPAPVLYWPNHGYQSSHTTTVLQAMNVGYGWPVHGFNYVTTAVTHADSGTMIIGGVRRSSNVPVLSKLPYVNRLFAHDYGDYAWFTELGKDIGGERYVPMMSTYTNGVVERLIDNSGSMYFDGYRGWSRNLYGANGVIVLTDGNWDKDGNGALDATWIDVSGRTHWNKLHRDFVTNGQFAWGQLPLAGEYSTPGYYGFVNGGPISGGGIANWSEIPLLRGTTAPNSAAWANFQTNGVSRGQHWFVPGVEHGNLTATGGIRLWDMGSLESVGTRMYFDSLDWRVPGRLHGTNGQGTPLGLTYQLADGQIEELNWELLALQGELSRERANRAYLLAALQEARQVESELRFTQTSIPARYRDVISQYYRVLSEDETDGLAETVDRFNSLLDEHRFEEAEAIAEAARWARPNEDVVQTMLWKTRFIRRLKGGDNGRFGLLSVDEAGVPFDDRVSYELPDVRYWQELSAGTRLTYDIGGQTLPSPHYLSDDVQYFPPGPEFKLSREAAAIKAFAEEERPKSRGGERRPPWEIEPTREMRVKVNDLIADIRDPEITILVDPRESRTIDLKRPALRSSVSDQRVARVQFLDDDTLELTGHAEGITTLTLWYESDSDEPEVLRYLVRVAIDDDEMDQFVGELEEYLERTHSQRNKLRQSLAAYVLARTQGRVGNPDVFYERPGFTGSNDLFSRLTSYAPGLQTSTADVQAILAAQADVAQPMRGSVDAGAKRLIDRARSLGWQKITHQGGAAERDFTVFVNGQGQFRYDRRTRFGLGETVISDGESLRHHYEEIGLGATRKLSRFHRQQLAAMVPWAVAPADDLAIGADVRLVGERTIAIVPLYVELGLPYVETRLVFADDGRLAERRLVARPDNKLLLQVAYQSDGFITWRDGQGEELHQHQLAVEPADAPEISPDESKLVVLPMPARTRDHVLIAANHTDGDDFRKLPKEAALALIASHGYTRNWETMQVIGQRFFDQGDRRLGFYTLLLASYGQWNPKDEFKVHTDLTVRFDPLKDHPDSPLSKYIVSQLHYQQVGHNEDPAKLDGPQRGFLQQLAEFRRQYVRWSTGRAQEGDSTERLRAAEEAVAFVERLDSPEFRWCLLAWIDAHHINNNPVRKRVSQAYGRLTEDPTLGHLARFEYGKALYAVEDYEKARDVFTQWYEDTLAAGVLPRINDDFHKGMRWDGSEKWNAMLRETAQEFVENGRRPTAMTLAWQIRQLGDATLANEIAGMALNDVPEADRFAVTLSGVEYFATTGQQRRALALLETLLSDDETASLSMLWRLGSSIAQSQQMMARSAKMLEGALSLEYGALGSDDVVNLEQLRSDYSELLDRYEELATALATLESEPSPALLSRLISVADRWRSMEDDVGLPCNRVAPIFTSLGADELAWEYITTPLAARPNEAAPWLDLANNMKSQENYAMADRAYREAFKSEGTNAQILWDHATMLQELGRHAEARKLLQQIVNTPWQPRFQHYKSQAEEALRN